jgi:hypothetical protein
MAQIYKMYHSKQYNITCLQRYNNEITSRSTRVTGCPKLPVKLKPKSSWLLGRCSRQLRRNCAGGNKLYSRGKSVFIVKHYFASKSSAAVCKAFSSLTRKYRIRQKYAGHKKCLQRKHVRCRTVQTGSRSARPNKQAQQQQQRLNCKRFLVSVLWAVAAGHRDLPSSPSQTLFCVNFLKSLFE